MNISDNDFQKEVIEEKNLPVLVDFWAPWCGPCRALGSIVEELEREYAGKIKILKLNVDENQETPGRFHVMSIPTLIFFKNSKPIKNIIGAQGKEALKKVIDEIIG